MPTTKKTIRKIKKSLMPAEKKQRMRILIAKDVIKLLATQPNFQVHGAGGYFTSEARVLKTWVTKSIEFGDRALSKPCTVCALGALFVADVVRNDKLKIKDMVASPTQHGQLIVGGRLSVYGSFIYKRLEAYFTRKQLSLIEAFFELWNSDNVPKVAWIDAWGSAYPFAADRARAIMANIVRNKGTFRPEEEFKNRKVKGLTNADAR